MMAQTEKDQAEAAEHLGEIKTRLSNLDQDMQQISDEVYENNRKLQQELLDATREEADQILQEAVTEARKEHLINLKLQQEQIVEVIMDISAKTIQKVIPSGVQDNLVKELTDRIWDLGKTDMHRVTVIRESLAGRTPAVQVFTPRPLTIDQKGNLIRTFSALADNDVELEIEIDESLIAGISVHIGDQVIENTVKSQLNQVEEEVERSLDQIYMEENDEA